MWRQVRNRLWRICPRLLRIPILLNYSTTWVSWPICHNPDRCHSQLTYVPLRSHWGPHRLLSWWLLLKVLRHSSCGRNNSQLAELVSLVQLACLVALMSLMSLMSLVLLVVWHFCWLWQVWCCLVFWLGWCV
jgi:hypothetical protein